MNERACDYCGAGMVLLRTDARFCSTKCRVYAARAARKRSELPEKMTKLGRFVRFTADKRPITASGRSASSTNPATWTSYEAAKASTAGRGIGFVLNGDGIGCIDLDHCFTNGVVAEWAQAVLDANPNTYTEISMSGDGLHIFGHLPAGPGRVIRDGTRNMEIYRTGRYIALTAQRYGRSPATLAPLVIEL